ncbi:4830_t:CDS:2, partial [Dentiscutata erythropus]
MATLIQIILFELSATIPTDVVIDPAPYAFNDEFQEKKPLRKLKGKRPFKVFQNTIKRSHGERVITGSVGRKSFLPRELIVFV